MLKLSKIEKSFGDRRVLSSVSLTVEKGDRAMLFGMSGCGKTTLLRIAAGLEKQDAGTVERNGLSAVVFAEPRLFPTATVLENVTAVMPRREKRDARKKAKEILEKKNKIGLKLLHFKETMLRQSSAGIRTDIYNRRLNYESRNIYSTNI